MSFCNNIPFFPLASEFTTFSFPNEKKSAHKRVLYVNSHAIGAKNECDYNKKA